MEAENCPGLARTAQLACPLCLSQQCYCEHQTLTLYETQKLWAAQLARTVQLGCPLCYLFKTLEWNMMHSLETLDYDDSQYVIGIIGKSNCHSCG